MCSGGEALPSSLSVLGTLRSVLTGSLGPLRGTRKVCYMYYTDVFVGSGKDIEKLKNALEAVVPDSVDLNKELTALADGLQNFRKEITQGGYSSSYSDKATWEELCKNCQCNSNPSRCSCSCPSVSSVCEPSDCCPNCDVRKAAKIFLGFIPCLYYGLKYLYDKCNGKGGWEDLNIANKDYSLGRFLIGMGYDVDKELNGKTGGEISKLLKTLFNGSPKGPLEKLYNVSKNYFTSRFTSHVPSSDSQPETVRDILLWLSGLPFASGFKALLEHCKDLCKPVENSKNSVNPENFETSLFDSCFLSPFVLGAIEGSKSNEEALKGFPPYKSEWQKFLYPSDSSALADMLFEYVRKIYIPLHFLRFQCERNPDQAGWKECYFGQKCSVDSGSGSSSSNSGCKCSGHDKYLCTNSHSSCSSSSCSSPCSHPLQAFLIDGSDSQSSDPKSLFALPGTTPMGFSKLSSTAKSGESLLGILEPFCDSSSTSLTSLVKSLICISRTPPETLGELFGFFQKFKDPPVFSSKFADYASKEPGRPDGEKFTNAFQSALETLKGSSHSSSHSGNSHSDLKSLYDCSTSTCGPYLNSLTGDVYTNFIDNFDETYLSWICYLPKDFKTLLEEFRKKFSDCCSSGNCQKIVECPCALPKFYAQGFTFASPNRLNGKKSCQNFLDQLKKVLQSNAPLQKLLNAIDEFLWHIRLPFVYAFLYIWILVISYFYYVQFYKLDLLHIDSHLHLPRSFKILPSTLFSDASSKLKDLSYFSL
ncbi:variant erythrocyte surface antigen-1 family protein [Babesia divergens]|uniref:Variant erythrocyte surface antigen-1 family protein n=1 Tax=Babesia divergens TaxID=32595 RepID=A0AAD9GIL9_BABDI|nr:variant erythrocyte surface antigen-1 family protein [Babesia divergens]